MLRSRPRATGAATTWRHRRANPRRGHRDRSSLSFASSPFVTRRARARTRSPRQRGGSRMAEWAPWTSASSFRGSRPAEGLFREHGVAVRRHRTARDTDARDAGAKSERDVGGRCPSEAHEQAKYLVEFECCHHTGARALDASEIGNASRPACRKCNSYAVCRKQHAHAGTIRDTRRARRESTHERSRRTNTAFRGRTP
jgi:hypothetical protein